MCLLVVYFQINLKGLRLNILSHLFDSLDHGNFFFSKSINGDVASLKQVLFLFLGARAWPPGFLQGGSGHPCFHTKGSYFSQAARSSYIVITLQTFPSFDR